MMNNKSPEEVKDYTFTADEERYLKNHQEKRFLIKGTPKQVEEILTDEIETLGIDELMVYAPLFEQEARLQSYKHLAKIFHKIQVKKR